jgi:chemosensory pili system protein ChpA (sensor histidine kinase/response regulator)
MTDARPILVVDDDEDIREVTSIVLELRGYHVEVASDGVEALERLSHGTPPMVVLLDMMMPRLDGEGFVAAVREKPGMSDVPIVLLSGHQDARQKAVDLHAAGFLAKPFMLDELLAVVRRFALDRS